jgi:hypothetical protein
MQGTKGGGGKQGNNEGQGCPFWPLVPLVTQGTKGLNHLVPILITLSGNLATKMGAKL